MNSLHPFSKKTGMLITCWFFMASLLQAQYYENVDSVPKRSKKNKQEREARMLQEYNIMDSILESKRFVLEASNLISSNGSRKMVNPGINFLMVDSARGVIQVGSDAGAGSNGVGGTTAEGSIMRWEFRKDFKRKNFTVSYSLMSALGTYDAVLYISAGGRATGRISGNLRGNLTFDGNIVPKTRSRVYKGRSY